MSLEPQRPFSPASVGSGRSSPGLKPSRRQLEDGLLRKDKSYRKYSAGIERALSSFDTAQQEWADYISFLGRLLKALQAHPNEISLLPQSGLVATRLAQCLNPSLPSGVHQKTLEVYSYIFSLIGSQALAQDLHLYFPGLSSVLSFASLTVRPLYIALLEDHIVKIDGQALRPALKSIILSLLPGLEEETSEDFDRTIGLVDRIRYIASSQQVADPTQGEFSGGDEFFWQCFFLASITSSARRQGALAYLNRRLPKLGHKRRRQSVVSNGHASNGEGLNEISTEALAVVSPEPGLLVRCFASGLADPQILVQRGFLDLLVSHIPLDSPVLQQKINSKDLELLVGAAVGVVTRRDMSLNRRLWAWLLGPEPATEGDGPHESMSVREETKTSPTAVYFSQYGLDALRGYLLRAIESKSIAATERAKPFRLCLSLMDRWEVGGLLVTDVFAPAMRSAYNYSQVANKEQIDEVQRSANIFFDGVESGLIWGELVRLIASGLGDPTSADSSYQLELVQYITTRFNIREDEMLIYHIPIAGLALFSMLHQKGQQNGAINQKSHKLALSIASNILSLVPDRTFQLEGPKSEGEVSGEVLTSDEVEDALGRIRHFYVHDRGDLGISEPPVHSRLLGPYLVALCQMLLSNELKSLQSQSTIEELAKIMSTLILKMRKSHILDRLNLLNPFQNALNNISQDSQAKIAFFPTISSITSLLFSLHRAGALKSEPRVEGTKSIVLSLVHSFWSHLSPSRPKHHVESVRHLRQLEAITSPSRIIEAVVATSISGHKTSEGQMSDCTSLEAARRFSVLWAHSVQAQGSRNERAKGHRRASSSTLPGDGPGELDFSRILTRPLLLLLDALADEDTEMYSFVSSWLQSLPSVSDVFLVLIRGLRSLNIVDRVMSNDPASRIDAMDGDVDDSAECLHLLRHLYHLVKLSSEQIWVTLAGATITISKRKSDDTEVVSLQTFLVQLSLRVLAAQEMVHERNTTPLATSIRRVALQLLYQIFQGPYTGPLRELEVEIPLLDMLIASLDDLETDLQPLYLDLVLSTSKLRAQEVSHSTRLRRNTRASNVTPRLSFQSEQIDEEPQGKPNSQPPPRLIECIRLGFTSPSSRFYLDDWVNFLTEALVIYENTIFQNMIPLVECFCKQISTVFGELKVVFAESHVTSQTSPESTLISLLNGLEQVLARAHERLVAEEAKNVGSKSPAQPQGFFGNMVTGILSPEVTENRSPSANNRLAVLLSFQDTVRISFSIWSWAGYSHDNDQQDASSVATFSYTSLRMRNRARRILEHLFAAEPLECLETLAMIWCRSGSDQKTPPFGLLHVLDGSRPKNTMPAMFNAIYNRTNPLVLDQTRVTTLTSQLSETELVGFLVEYTKSVEDDAMDEIWPDCMTFLRDVLANPMPQRQILPNLLEFTVVLAEKLENTSFGDQKRMRRELSDLFTRLLTATFTTRGSVLDLPSSSASDKPNSQPASRLGKPLDLVEVLALAVPRLGLVLDSNDRISAAASSICTSVLSPIFRSKNFPDNATKATIDLLYQLSRLSQASKVWRREANEAFNDPRFFATSSDLIESSWMPILRQLSISDRDRLPELLSRIAPPTTAGIVFGVGAVSARLEADRRTQLVLRRVALLILAAAEDNYVQHLPLIQEKMNELLAATATSSPSSAARADLYMLLRALILRTTPSQLAPFWPVLNAELHAALSSVLPDSENQETHNAPSTLQACKLLDLLITVAPDDFQLLEWLYITDTIDAVYRPADWQPSALVDEISDELGALGQSSPGAGLSGPQITRVGGKRRLLLEVEDGLDLKRMEKSELVAKVLRPWFGHLSITAFEGVYGMGSPDLEQCEKSVLSDICDDGTIL
ncbi:MAG: hypothetical protein M1820_009687 [Bogoriella megaspora]|nr:MAG: hypothetical protein M1820_009687 [Bogoriella megaspora]